MARAAACIIEKNPLIREGLKSILDKSKFEVKAEISHINSFEKNDHCELTIISTDETSKEIIEYIESLKAIQPNTRILILSQNIDREIVIAAFSSGADGILLKDISAEALVASLDLIMTGEKVFPSSTHTLIAAAWNDRNDDTAESFDESEEFSPRAIEIIRCLAAGMSNKLIARNLGITEATVKVHLKSILRKLELANRTQIAIWAVNHGIMPQMEKAPSILRTN